MTTNAILKKLLEAIKPGAKLNLDTSRHLAAELRRFAGILESEPHHNQMAGEYKNWGKGPPKKKKQKREMDYTRFQTRYVALEVMYLGWGYQGFARQDHNPNTVEGHMFQALERTCLVPPESKWEDISYSRCGRTDIGVSAVGQVVTLRIRSRALQGDALPDEGAELDYPCLLNKVLPRDIQITGWREVPAEFHARFTANSREYKYFISGAQHLDLVAMQQAAQVLQGEHNFQNYCKMDLSNTMTYSRLIHTVSVEPGPPTSGGSAPPLVLTVHGRAFLWHQVRCIAAVLIMVGKGQESPDITAQLLDAEAHPHKPQYDLASERPLLLHRVGFGAGYSNLTFGISERAAKDLLQTMDAHEARFAEEAALFSAVHARVRAACAEHLAAYSHTENGHTQLFRRGFEPSFAERLAAWHAKGNSVNERQQHRVFASPAL